MLYEHCLTPILIGQAVSLDFILGNIGAKVPVLEHSHRNLLNLLRRRQQETGFCFPRLSKG